MSDGKGTQRYILKAAEIPILSFDLHSDFWGETLHIVDFYNNLLPPYFITHELSDQSLYKWLRNRIIPRSRIYADRLLIKYGLSCNLVSSMAKTILLSLNDSYWIMSEDKPIEWPNPYKNPFADLSRLALTGDGSVPQNYLSPEFTTAGRLPKCWYKEPNTGKILLYKGELTEGTVAAEYFASQLADAMRINHVSYNIGSLYGQKSSVCELFTTEEVSYASMAHICSNFRDVVSVLKKIEEQYGISLMSSLADMLVFDAIILNEDRHLNNFGLLFKNGKPICFAPLYDHGCSLLRNTKHGLDDKTVKPVLYNDFFEAAAYFATERQKSILNSIIDVRFNNHPLFTTTEVNRLSDRISKRVRALVNML